VLGREVFKLPKGLETTGATLIGLGRFQSKPNSTLSRLIEARAM
jgi:hypothetical protein